MKPLFAADSMGKSFGRKRVLKAASVWAIPGKITVLFGRNGSGKSTLLKVSVGLLSADFGVVHFAGRARVRPRLHRLAAEGLFYLPDRDLLSPRWTLAEHIAALDWRFGTEHSKEVLESLGVAQHVTARPTELSGGERRRAEIALAWIRRPLCLLADEPFAGIAPADAEVVARGLLRLARSGCALVVAGHEVPQLMQVADTVVWLVAGTTHGLGPPEEASRHEQFRREYLGPGWGP
jgi:lipopolysaccharide export system ATP-binding protein